MNINPYIFRGYDLRGLVDKDLNPEIAEWLGRAYGTFLVKRGIKKAVVGHDCRLTSEAYSEAITKGMLESGIDVVDIGLALAGNVYWAQYYFKAPGCILVSASHNPVEYNGFKFGTGFSTTMNSEEIQELRQIAEKGKFANGSGKLEKKDIKQEYFNDLIKRFSVPFDFKVVIEPSHSTPGAFVPELLQRAGCRVICSHCEIDGTFPLGTPDPTEKRVAERLAKKVLEEKADIGISYDCDGDRIGVVDEKGNILWNDVLLALFASDALERTPGAKIVFNTLSSKMVQDVIQLKGGQAIMWRTGHSFIKAKAQQEKAVFAGEVSGHFCFLDRFYSHDDGCFSTLALLSCLSRLKQTLSQVVADLPQYVSSPEIKLGCPDELKVGLIDKISEKLHQDFPKVEIITDERVGDGVRLETKDSMFVIRYSQNGPYLTVRFEAREQARYDELKSYIRGLLKSYPEIIWQGELEGNVESLK